MKNIVINQITLCADGSVGIQLLKQIIDDGEVVFSEPHRTVVDCFGNVIDQVQAVNDHLAKMGYPPIPDEGVTRIQTLRDVQNASPVVKKRMNEVRLEREDEAKLQEDIQKVNDLMRKNNAKV